MLERLWSELELGKPVEVVDVGVVGSEDRLVYGADM
jgi:hypothetical protein